MFMFFTFSRPLQQSVYVDRSVYVMLSQFAWHRVGTLFTEYCNSVADGTDMGLLKWNVYFYLILLFVLYTSNTVATIMVWFDDFISSRTELCNNLLVYVCMCVIVLTFYLCVYMCAC